MRSSSFFLVWVYLLFIFNSNSSLSLPFLPLYNVTLYGDAFFRNYAISLTKEPTCLSDSSSSSSGVGRALYARPIRFLDPKAKSAASFFSRFSFSIVPSRVCPLGNGLAFFITSKADSFSFNNGFMGLPDNNGSRDEFVAVEFDTSYDPFLGDINGNHIGIDINSVRSFGSVDAASRGIDLTNGKKITAWIEYRDSTKLLSVWAAYSLVRPESPLLVAQVDLSKQLKEYMYVGFSASNGQGSATHLIDRWQFKTFGPASSSTAMDGAEEGDCFICSPEDIDVYGNAIDSPKRLIKVSKWVLILGCSAAGVVFVVIVTSVICFFLSIEVKRNERRVHGRHTYSRVPEKLSLAQIRLATMEFNRNRIIGEGASATVYKGSLPSGAVAVKRFHRAGEIQSFWHNPFTTEFATMVSCLRHKNLVQLQGWCCEGSELVLVYEYMPNGSLEKLLHKTSSSPSRLTWKRRRNIVLGVASALTYLHEECERLIIHRDVKACNIMLDAEFNAKLGDFGLAEVYEHSCCTREATIPAGTMGYLAPEYVFYGVPTEKTDVYSYGVVVLEVATGRRPVDDEGHVIVDWVWDLWEKKKIFDAVDPRLMGNFNTVEMEILFMVGLACVHPDQDKRPTVKEAARMIKGEALPPVLPARKPTLRIRSTLPEDLGEARNSNGGRSPGEVSSYMTPRTHFGLE